MSLFEESHPKLCWIVLAKSLSSLIPVLTSVKPQSINFKFVQKKKKGNHNKTSSHCSQNGCYQKDENNTYCGEGVFKHYWWE